MQLTEGYKYHVGCLKHMFERGATLSFGKIGVKFEKASTFQSNSLNFRLIASLRQLFAMHKKPKPATKQLGHNFRSGKNCYW